MRLWVSAYLDALDGHRGGADPEFHQLAQVPRVFDLRNSAGQLEWAARLVGAAVADLAFKTIRGVPATQKPELTLQPGHLPTAIMTTNI